MPRALDLGTRQTFVVCLRSGAHGKRPLLSCAHVLPCASCLGTRQMSSLLHVMFLPCVLGSTTRQKNKFAACPKICTRQKFGHTANRPFPVVMSRYRGLNNRLYIQCPDR